MPVSVVSICNLALSHVGAYSIGAIDERSAEARVCMQHYDTCRDETLRSFPWAFAGKTVPLALASGVSYPNWSYAYALPADCLKANRLVHEGMDLHPEKEEPFSLMSGATGTIVYLLTNLEQAWLEYTAKVTDPTVYDSQFVGALSYRLASSISTALSANDAKRRELMQFYQLAVQEAKASSANEGSKENKINRYVRSRG